MLFGEYHLTGVLEDEASLPPYKGSTFRGLFGRALKEVVCALKRQECPYCLLRQQCVYTRVFEPPPEVQSRGSPAPHPFVIEPMLDSRTWFPPGSPFHFTLLLFGPANQYLPYFVFAFQEMGRIGLGRRVRGRRARFHLLSVSSPSAGLLYRAEEGVLAPGQPVPLSLESRDPGEEGISEITLTLLTPLRLKYQNHLQAELPFHVLLRAVLRRLAVLWRHFGPGEPALDYQGLVTRAQGVKVLRERLTWWDWRRYSHRQEVAMLLGGLVGEITYRGPLGEFLPFLRLAEKVHLGKNTTFGLGKIGIVATTKD